MLNRYGWQMYHWHIEPSSKCSLKCPRCPRQEHPDISWMQKEISLQDICQRLRCNNRLHKIIQSKNTNIHNN